MNIRFLPMSQTEFSLPLAIDFERARDYILGRACAQGGFSFYRTPEWGVDEPSAPDTFAALAALRLLDVSPPDSQRHVNWLLNLQSDDGGWPTLTIGWAACEGLRLLRHVPRRDPRRWLDRLLKRMTRKPQAADSRHWGGTLVDGLRLARLCRLHAPELLEEARPALQQRLDAAAMPEGVWARPGPDLETTGIALRLARLADLRIDHERIAQWWRQCEDPQLGLRLAPSAAATSATALNGGLITAEVLSLPLRHPAAIAAQISLLQHPSGGFGARHGALATLWDTWQALGARQSLLRHITEENRHE